MQPADTTIAAIATPKGSGGIGIVKVSGPAAIRKVEEIFLPGKGRKILRPTTGLFSGSKSNFLHYGRIFNPVTGSEIDEVLVSVMKKPKSYTGQDIVEINAHGGPYVLNEILRLLLSTDEIKAAKPGEFTFRAFLNGKIDLIKAEAISELINAKSRVAAKLAYRQMQGELRNEIDSIIENITQIQANIEAQIEFGEEIIDTSEWVSLNNIADRVIRDLEGLIKKYKRRKLIQEGIRVVIAGKPNVGKSSLLNALSHSKRSIVTNIPGTTRDTIDIEIKIGAANVILTDTAGIQNTADPVEILGIERAKEKLACADCVLCLIDVSQPQDEGDDLVMDLARNGNSLLVGNKADLLNPWKGNRKIHHPILGDAILVSALHDIGIKNLINEIAKKCEIDSESLEEMGGAPNERHQSILKKAKSIMENVKIGIETQRPLELISYDVKLANETIGEISGENPNEDVYHKIFSQFCVGK